MQQWLRRWGERSRPLESLPMLHDCAMVFDGEGCHDVNPLVDEPERLHSRGTQVIRSRGNICAHTPPNGWFRRGP